MMIYEYQLIQKGASWGISIKVDAEVLNNELLKGSIKISDNIFLSLDINFNLIDEELNYLILGIQSKLDELKPLVKDSFITFRVTNLIFDDADFQPEGLYLTIVGWICKRYQLQESIYHVDYNKTLNKYIFDL